MIYRLYVVSKIFIGLYLRKAEWVRAAAKSVVVMWINISAPHVGCSKFFPPETSWACTDR